MPSASLTPRLAGIQLHPIKSLDPAVVGEARIGPAGGLELDRVWTLHPAEGQLSTSLGNVKARDTSLKVTLLNGKRTAAVHRIRTAFSPALDVVTRPATSPHPRTTPIRFSARYRTRCRMVQRLFRAANSCPLHSRRISGRHHRQRPYDYFHRNAATRLRMVPGYDVGRSPHALSLHSGD